MSIRTDILEALRLDFNVSGNKESWKFAKQLDDVPDSKFPSNYIALGTAVNKVHGDMQEDWDVPVLCIVYFKCDTDSNNSGLLETEAERLIALYKAVIFTNTSAVDAVVSLDPITVTPYINTGVENKGFLLLEYKLNYIGA